MLRTRAAAWAEAAGMETAASTASAPRTGEDAQVTAALDKAGAEAGRAMGASGTWGGAAEGAGNFVATGPEGWLKAVLEPGIDAPRA